MKIEQGNHIKNEDKPVELINPIVITVETLDELAALRFFMYPGDDDIIRAIKKRMIMSGNTLKRAKILTEVGVKLGKRLCEGVNREVK